MSTLSKNIIYNLLGQGMMMLLGFISVRYVFKQLGEEALGIISFTTMLNMVLTGVLDKGVYSTTVREVSFYSNSEPLYVQRFIQTGSFFTWGFFLIFGTLVYFGAPLLVEHWLILKNLDFFTTVTLVQILGVASLSTFPRSFYASLLRGLQKMKYNNLIDVGITGLQQIGTILIILYEGTLFHVVCWFLACYILSILLYFVTVMYFFSSKSFIPKYSHSVIIKISGFVSKMISVSILSMIHNQMEKLILSKMFSIGVFGYYNFAYNTVSKAGLITNSISQAALPSLSILVKVPDRKKLLEQFEKLQEVICYTTLPIFIAIPFFSMPLFSYLFTDSIAYSLLLPISFLSLGFYMNGTINLPYQLSLAFGKAEITVRSNLYALTILPMTVVLIFLFGLNGAGFSLVLFNLFAYLYTIPRIFKECLGVSAKPWFHIIFKVFFLAICTYGLAYLLLIFMDRFNIISLGIAYIGGSILFLGGAYFLIGNVLKIVLHDFIRTLNFFNA
jgi:O-antigen/teichoic acid export membrane protein